MNKNDARPSMPDKENNESAEPRARLSYELIDLIAHCDLSEPEPADLEAWNDMPSVGRESLVK